MSASKFSKSFDQTGLLTLKHINELLYLIDSDQRPDSNRCPLTSFPQIMVLFKGILKSRLFQILRSMADLLVRVGVYVSDVDLRKWETAIDLRIWKKDIYLRYRCLWRRNRTWIWELDVDLSLAYLQSDDDYTRWNTILLLPLHHLTLMGLGGYDV
jgi:hypothetical protein